MISGLNSKLLISLVILATLGFFAYHYFSYDGQVEILVKQLKSKEAEERITAIEQLTALGDEAKSSLKEIERLIQDDDYNVRHSAISALLSLDQAYAIDALNYALDSKYPEVRIDAAEALENIGSEESTEVLNNYSHKAEESHNKAAFDKWADKVRKEYGLPTKHKRSTIRKIKRKDQEQ